MKILDKIVTPGFITWNAHMFFAAFVVSTALWYLSPVIVIALALALAAFKEFYIDKHFEEGQTFKKNLTDFAGYAAGVAFGYFAQHKVMGYVIDQAVAVISLVCRPVT